MNRDIRFRAFLQEEKLMVYDNSEHEYHISYLNTMEKEVFVYPLHSTFHYGKNGIGGKAYLMQYTGLKDKHGKPIYERDIVKDIRNGELLKVEWDEECALFKFAYGSNENDWCFADDLWLSEIEVVGNDLENPELWDQYFFYYL